LGIYLGSQYQKEKDNIEQSILLYADSLSEIKIYSRLRELVKQGNESKATKMLHGLEQGAISTRNHVGQALSKKQKEEAEKLIENEPQQVVQPRRAKTVLAPSKALRFRARLTHL